MTLSNWNRSRHRLGVIALIVGLFAILPLGAQGQAQTTYDLLVSSSADRSSPTPLGGATVTGAIHVFTSPDTSVKQVVFYLDDPTMSGTPFFTEGKGPFDFNGTAKNNNANPYQTASLPNGPHEITARITLTNGFKLTVSRAFTVLNRNLVLNEATMAFVVDHGTTEVQTETVGLDTSDETAASYSVASDADWLSVDPVSGTSPDVLTISADPRGLAPGTHKGNVTVSAAGYGSDTMAVELTVEAKLLLSTSPDRSAERPLAGEEVWNDIYVFVKPESGISKADFYVDDPAMAGAVHRSELGAPWDLQGGTAAAAAPFDTTALVDGAHTITASLTVAGGKKQVVSATFEVINGAPGLAFDPESITFPLDPGQGGSQTTTVSTTDGSTTPFDVTVTGDAPWLTVSPLGGTSPAGLTLQVDTDGLELGIHKALVRVRAGGYRAGTLPVELRVGCPPLPCSEVLVDLPYELDFSQDDGKILDGSGVGTGFSWIDSPTNAVGYIPQNLSVDTDAGVLEVTTTKGLAFSTSNSLDNALAVGIDAPSQVSAISATLVDPSGGTGNFEQAGVWFGTDEDNYSKLVVNSTPDGLRIQHLMEVNGRKSVDRETSVLNLTGATVSLSLYADPGTQKISGFFRVNGGASNPIGSFTAPSEFFSFDAARIDPRIGTQSFGGIFASHRNGSPLVYRFDYFGVSEATSASPPPSQGFGFARTSFPLQFPTSMAWGPDGRLYVSELFGRIHALTLGPENQVVADERIDTIGFRLTLGVAIDPASTAENVILWVSHSDPSLDNAPPNSSVVTRLSGPGFSTRNDVITGLPRSKANHSVNSLQFGADGKLYIAVSGNAGAGGRDSDTTGEFGDRGEQPLSAAIVVADVNAADFDGSCANTTDIYGPAPCDVVPWTTGLRNMYDFVFHSNGSAYGPDNGLGVGAVIPPTATPPCTDFGTFDPGTQADSLFRLVPGKYYGHPNPARGECVFKDGIVQGVPPLPNYEPPLLSLGDHRSANGIIEYTGEAFCGELKGELLITNYSVGDDITRVRLSPDGTTVSAAGSLVAGFNDPLPIIEGDDGAIFVGEFRGDEITVLRPLDLGCWSPKQKLPVQLLDAGGTALGGKLYVVGGKTGAGHQSTMHVYDPAADTWTAGPSLPGPAVENPAVVGLNGKLYVFGGSTSPFSGAVAGAHVFDPATGTWNGLAPMPTARGGATAQAIGGKIYVAGGMGDDGASLATVEVFDPATGAWAARSPLATRRDNPGSAAMGGKLYVFGGRTRNGDGTTVDATLASGEVYDPAANAWSEIASMPTGRRTMVVGTLNGRAQVIGGEQDPDGLAYRVNEEYDPETNSWRSLKDVTTARHGAAAGTIDGKIYVVGGGPVGGLSFTDANEVFRFEADS